MADTVFYKTIKEGAGSYVRTNGKHKVKVSYFDHLNAWIAAAEWDACLYTDPVATKREAIMNADYMLKSKGGPHE